jgi:hypothetical protein
MMKNIISGLLALTVCLSLAACGETGAQPKESSQVTDGMIMGSDEGTVVKDEAATYRLDSYTVADEQRSEDGQLLASCEYKIPQLTALHTDGTPFDPASEGNTTPVKVMENVNQYFTDWLTEEQKWFAEMTQMAREDYAQAGKSPERWSGDDTYYYSDTMGFTSWQNESLLSITMETYGFTGGVHGYSSKSAVTFELCTGSIVHPSDLASDFSKLDEAVTGEILRQIEERKAGDEQNMYFDDYATTVKGWTERAVSVNDSGITVTFPAYDLAPYAAGEQSFEIPFELIQPYFSAEALELLGLK